MIYEYNPETNSIRGNPRIHFTAEQISKAVATMNELVQTTHEEPKPEKPKEPEQQYGVSGPPCVHCQNEFYHRTGTCLTCTNCNESSSCG